MGYVASNDIRIFPTSNRSLGPTGTNWVTEHNLAGIIANLVNKVGNNKGFVVLPNKASDSKVEDDKNIVFYLEGYLISAKAGLIKTAADNDNNASTGQCSFVKFYKDNAGNYCAGIAISSSVSQDESYNFINGNDVTTSSSSQVESINPSAFLVLLNSSSQIPDSSRINFVHLLLDGGVIGANGAIDIREKGTINNGGVISGGQIYGFNIPKGEGITNNGNIDNSDGTISGGKLAGEFSGGDDITSASIDYTSNASIKNIKLGSIKLTGTIYSNSGKLAGVISGGDNSAGPNLNNAISQSTNATIKNIMLGPARLADILYADGKEIKKPKLTDIQNGSSIAIGASVTNGGTISGGIFTGATYSGTIGTLTSGEITDTEISGTSSFAGTIEDSSLAGTLTVNDEKIITPQEKETDHTINEKTRIIATRIRGKGNTIVRPKDITKEGGENDTNYIYTTNLALLFTLDDGTLGDNDS